MVAANIGSIDNITCANLLNIFATKSNLRMHIKVKHIFETAREQSFSTGQNILHTL